MGCLNGSPAVLEDCFAKGWYNERRSTEIRTEKKEKKGGEGHMRTR